MRKVRIGGQGTIQKVNGKQLDTAISVFSLASLRNITDVLVTTWLGQKVVMKILVYFSYCYGCSPFIFMGLYVR